jgi:hypothetical protein
MFKPDRAGIREDEAHNQRSIHPELQRPCREVVSGLQAPVRDLPQNSVDKATCAVENSRAVRAVWPNEKFTAACRSPGLQSSYLDCKVQRIQFREVGFDFARTSEFHTP